MITKCSLIKVEIFKVKAEVEANPAIKDGFRELILDHLAKAYGAMDEAQQYLTAQLPEDVK